MSKNITKKIQFDLEKFEQWLKERINEYLAFGEFIVKQEDSKQKATIILYESFPTGYTNKTKTLEGRIIN